MLSTVTLDCQENWLTRKLAIPAAVSVNPVTKKGSDWLLGNFLLGTEIGEGQLKEVPCTLQGQQGGETCMYTYNAIPAISVGKKAWINSVAIIVHCTLMIGMESSLKATFETFSRGFQLKEARVDIKTKTTITT